MIAIVITAFISCGGDDAKDVKLEVSPEELVLSEDGEGMLIITSNVKWEISTTASWLTFSASSGEGGC